MTMLLVLVVILVWTLAELRRRRFSRALGDRSLQGMARAVERAQRETESAPRRSPDPAATAGQVTSR